MMMTTIGEIGRSKETENLFDINECNQPPDRDIKRVSVSGELALEQQVGVLLWLCSMQAI